MSTDAYKNTGKGHEFIEQSSDQGDHRDHVMFYISYAVVLEKSEAPPVPPARSSPGHWCYCLRAALSLAANTSRREQSSAAQAFFSPFHTLCSLPGEKMPILYPNRVLLCSPEELLREAVPSPAPDTGKFRKVPVCFRGKSTVWKTLGS